MYFRGGLLDEFIILDKTLEAGEVAELYMSEEPFKPTKNTKLYLNFDGTNEGISETLN